MHSSKSGSPTSASFPSSPNSRSLNAWVLAARPKTLTAAVVPVLVGSAVASALGYALVPSYAGLALLAALCLQIATNFINDALDFEKGADTEERLGPTRAVQSGLLDAKAVMRAGYALLALAVVFAVPLVAARGWPIAALAVVSVVCGYAYTGGPVPLAYVGLGDLFVLLFFGIAAVAGTAFLHAGVLEPAFVVAGVQIGLLATVLIAINNLRDIDGDTKVGKHTLAVRLGKHGARIEIALLVVISFVSCFYWPSLGLRWAGALPWLVFPMALRILRDVFRTEPGPAYNGYLAKSAALHLLFGALLAGGLALR